MRLALLVIAALLIALLTPPCAASLKPSDVVVVYNTDSRWNDTQGRNISKMVADYYCKARKIPPWDDAHTLPGNELGIDWHAGDWPTVASDSNPGELFTFLLHDQGTAPGLLTFLRQRCEDAGVDPDDPATDPTKCIVLCYGIPYRLMGRETYGSPDSFLTLLFNKNPWGRGPIGAYPDQYIDNPFYYSSDDRPMDFGDLRAGPRNSVAEQAPHFTKVRMLTNDRAIAGGQRGMLFVGQWTGTTWQWDAVPDEDKDFIRGDVADITVVDATTAFVLTATGTIIGTYDGGETWTEIAPGNLNWIGSYRFHRISFYKDAAGTHGCMLGMPSPDDFTPERVVMRYNSADGAGLTGLWSSKTSTSGPASDFYPRAAAYVDATHMWVCGTDGIWFTDGTKIDGVVSWQHVYSSDPVNNIWVGKVGAGYVGWALTGSNKVLRYDGTGWSEAQGAPLLPLGGGDLAVSDADHLAVAYGDHAFVLYDGTSWTVDTSDGAIAKGSLSWAGGNHICSVDGATSTVRTGTGTPGGFAWSTSESVPDYSWKMRYLVCRLDGYKDQWASIDESDPTKMIPSDIKNMIDRSIASDPQGSPAYDGKFVLDGPAGSHHAYHDTLVSKLTDSIGGASNLIWDESSVWKNQNNDNIGAVIGYSSSGSYHWGAGNVTRWWRPLNMSFKNGAVAVSSGVSGDVQSLREPRFVWSFTKDTAHVQAGKLKVYLWDTGSDPNGIYSTHWARLHSQADGSVLASAQFTGTETITRSAGVTRTIRTATIDLSSVTNWPANHQTYVALHFPADDPLHPDLQDPLQPGGVELWREPAPGHPASTAVWSAWTQGTGMTYYADIAQSLSPELIRAGCSATAGNVTEPYDYGCPVPEIILRQYARGCTWGESAYMGMRYLAWMEVAIGDPLMAPFDAQPSPTVAFVAPSPADGARVCGQVALEATASPDGSGAVQKVEFWAVKGQNRVLLSEDYQAPYECTWDTGQMSGGSRVYPDGDYTIQACVCQTGNSVGSATISRTVTVDSSISHAAISDPWADNAMVDLPGSIHGEASGSSSMQFWLFSGSGPVLLGESTGPDFQCSVSDSLTDGIYDLQAIGLYTGTAAYSPRRKVLLLHPLSGVAEFGSVGQMGAVQTGDEVMIGGLPVVAGTSNAMEGAFYVEDYDREHGTVKYYGRACGMRVQTTSPVATGEAVIVRGVFHAGDARTERYVEASQIWHMGTVDVPKPLAITTRSLLPPIIQPQNPLDPPSGGLLDPPGGGMLVTVTGRVTYTDSYFTYVDDGCAMPGNDALQSRLAWASGQEIHLAGAHPTGVLVYATGPYPPDLSIGSLVCVTGISSSRHFHNLADPLRCVRVRGNEVSHPVAYTFCTKWNNSNGHFGNDAQCDPPRIAGQMHAGDRIRLEDVTIQSNDGTRLLVADNTEAGALSEVIAPTDTTATEFVAGARITVLGTVMDGTGDYGDVVQPECIFLNSDPQLTSLASRSAQSNLTIGEQVATLPTDPISEALGQEDGSAVSLNAVQISNLPDGYFGVKQTPEILFGAPRLVIARSCQVQPSWMVDVHGSITTLASGQRAVTGASVWLYTDAAGRAMPPNPLTLAPLGADWPWKRQIQ